MFVPLHVKSEYSAGEGTATVESLVARVAAHGAPALALTDIENLYGQLRFQHAARAAGIRAIPGVELRAGFAPGRRGLHRGRVVLLARTARGYETLCRTVSLRRARVPGAHAPTPPPLDTLDALLALDGHERLDAFGDDLFLLSDDGAVLEELLRRGAAPAQLRHLLVRPNGGPPRATSPRPPGIASLADPDVVMLDPDDHTFHRLLVALRTRRTVEQVDDAESPARSLPSPASLAALFADAPDALAESGRVAAACTFDLLDRPPVGFRLPRPGGLRAETVLADRCRARLAAARATVPSRLVGPHYDRRLERELAVIEASGFAELFLAVGALVDEAHARGVPVTARGSAVASLVTHLLGASAADPVAERLLFERFLHAGRRRPPDIDLDLPSTRRDAMVEWLAERFGAARLAQVAAHHTFGLRAAFRFGLAALGLPPAAIARFADALPPDELAADLALPPPLELLPPAMHDEVPRIRRLLGHFRHVGVHAAGVVLVDPEVARHAPLERAPKGVVITQYDMHALEAVGIVKLDLLGNRALDAIARATALAGIPAPGAGDDAGTLALLREGRTLGCFQVESPPVRATIARLPLAGRDDLVAALALVRPGAASGHARAAFIRRAWGEEAALPPHPRLAEVFADTHGLPLYEEQLATAIARATGWPLERSDVLRERIADAGDDPAELAGLGRTFVGAATASGFARDEAEAVWTMLARFAGYAFNRAHAVSQAALAGQAAFLKAHHPLAFACAVLEHYGGQYPARTIAAEMARLVALRAPHVEHSDLAARPEGGAVRLGLAAVRGVSAPLRARILAARPFCDLADFLARVEPKPAERTALVLAGALDGLAPLLATAYPFAHEEALRRLAGAAGPAALAGFVAPRVSGGDIERYRALVRARNELRYLAMHPSAHPLALLRDEATAAGCVPIATLARGHGDDSANPVAIVALVAATRRVATRGGRVVQFVTLEDETGLVEAVVPPRPFGRSGDTVRGPGPHLVRGRVELDHRVATLRVTGVLPFYRRRAGVHSR